MNKDTDKTDLLVIGGGIMGLFHAYHALRNGLSVRLLEKNRRPQGASVRNFGQVVPSGMTPTWQRLGRKSLEYYQELNERWDLRIVKQGTTYLASNAAEWTLLEELASINQDEAYSSQLWDRPKCLQQIPCLQKDYVYGGLHFPDELSLDPAWVSIQLLQGLQTELHLQYHAQTTAIEVLSSNEGCTTHTSDGQSFQSAKVIICSGSEFQLLFPHLFSQSDLVATKLQMLQTAPQSIPLPGNVLTGSSIRRYESFQDCSSYSKIKMTEQQDSPWKKWGVHILFKQTPDGSIIVGDSHEYQAARKIDDLGFEINPMINQFILEEAQKIIQLDDWTLSRQWFGIYCQCKERDVFEERIEKDIHIFTGIGGKGMTASPGYSESNIRSLFNV